MRFPNTQFWPHERSHEDAKHQQRTTTSHRPSEDQQPYIALSAVRAKQALPSP